MMRELKRCMANYVSRLISNENGVAAVLVALMMVVIMGFGALAVDVGSLYKARREMVTAADAAALAGASHLALTATENDGVADTAGAIAVAENYAIARNGAGTVEVNIVNVGSDQAIEVKAKRNEDLFLAKALGFMNNDVAARAVATWGYPTEMIGGNLFPLIINERQFPADELHLKLDDPDVFDDPLNGNWGLLDIDNGTDSIVEALQGYPVNLESTFVVGEIMEAYSKTGLGGNAIIKAVESNMPKPEQDGRMVRAAEGMIGMTGWVPIFKTEDSGGKLDLVILGFAAFEITDIITEIVKKEGVGSSNAFVEGAPVTYGSEVDYPRGMIIGKFITGQVVDADIANISQNSKYNYGMYKVKLVE
jgi:Flp pilus assembly protein TadG